MLEKLQSEEERTRSAILLDAYLTQEKRQFACKSVPLIIHDFIVNKSNDSEFEYVIRAHTLKRKGNEY